MEFKTHKIKKVKKKSWKETLLPPKKKNSEFTRVKIKKKGKVKYVWKKKAPRNIYKKGQTLENLTRGRI